MEKSQIESKKKVTDLQLKKEFLQSMKRLTYYYNNLKTYNPKKQLEKYPVNIIDRDFTQQYQMYTYQNPFEENPNVKFRSLSNEERFQSLKLDEFVVNSMIQETADLLPDEDDIEKAMVVTQAELQGDSQKDVMMFEQASNVMRQSRKFQYLIHRQENQTFKKQVQKKQKEIDNNQNEINDLEEQLRVLEKNIEDRKNIQKQIKEDIVSQNIDSARIIDIKNNKLKKLKQETEMNKREYREKFDVLDDRLDDVRYRKNQLIQSLQQLEQRNNMMWFFPIKVQEQQDRIAQKKVELELYKNIITNTLGFIKQRIQESRKKQELVAEVNSYIGDQIELTLQEESEFYDRTDKDKLKTPPFVHVKRIERPGTKNAIPKQTAANPSGRKSRSPKKYRRGQDDQTISSPQNYEGIQIKGVLGANDDFIA